MQSSGMSYIKGYMRHVIDGKWVTIIEGALIKFDLEPAYPIISVMDPKSGVIQYISFEKLEKTNEQNNIFALVFKEEGKIIGVEFGELFNQFSEKAHKNGTLKVFAAILNRAKISIADKQKPYSVAIKTKVPTSFDFSNSFDTQLIFCTDLMKRIGGYASVSVVCKQEAEKTKLGGSPFLVFDTEHSGQFVEEITQKTFFQFSENSVCLQLTGAGVVIELLFNEKLDQFKKVFMDEVKALYKKKFKANDEDIEYVFATSLKKDTVQNDFYEEEGEVIPSETTQKQKSAQFFNARKEFALKQLDDLVVLVNQKHKFTKVTFYGDKTKLCPGETKLMGIQADEKLALFDINKQTVAQQFKHSVNGTSVTAGFDDFIQGDDQNQIANLQISAHDLVVAAGGNAVFGVDLRSNETIGEFNYKTSFDCTTIAISSCGSVAVAFKDSGEIKLFNKLGQRAANSLIGFGFDIIGMIFSPDSKYLIATTNNQVIIYPLVGTDGTSYLSGTVKATARQDPILIKLSPTQLKQVGGGLRPCTFINDMIVSGCGNHVLAWNWQKVLSGKPICKKFNVGQPIVGVCQLGQQTVAGAEDGFYQVNVK